MLSIVPPPTDRQDENAPTCHEYLGTERGWCSRGAHQTDVLGFWFCWPHAAERGLHA